MSNRTSERKCLKETASQTGPIVCGGAWEWLEVGARRERAWLWCRGALHPSVETKNTEGQIKKRGPGKDSTGEVG